MSITWWRGHCTTCFIYVCNMSRSHVWHDSFSAFPTNCTIYQFSEISTWPIHKYNMTHPHVWLDPNLGVLHQQHNLSIFRDIHMTHPYVLHGNVGGRGRERPKKKKLPLLKKDKKKSRKWRKRLLQNYWYKIPVLHVLKYHLMSAM